jgi:hypothetical protein
MTSDGKSGVVKETIVLAIWMSYCALCDNQPPSNPRDRIHRSSSSETGALRNLAFHREERHIADWFPDPPKCEGCGESGPIPNDTEIIRVICQARIREKVGGVCRLQRDDNVPCELPEQWWHSNCHSRYFHDAAFEDEVDERYADRIKEEKAWAEEVRALIDETEEEGVLWGRDWKRRVGTG